MALQHTQVRLNEHLPLMQNIPQCTKKMAAEFLRIPPHRGLCWDENSKKPRRTNLVNSVFLSGFKSVNKEGMTATRR